MLLFAESLRKNFVNTLIISIEINQINIYTKKP